MKVPAFNSSACLSKITWRRLLSRLWSSSSISIGRRRRLRFIVKAAWDGPARFLACYLMVKKGLTAEEAILACREAEPAAVESVDQFKMLAEFEAVP